MKTIVEWEESDIKGGVWYYRASDQKGAVGPVNMTDHVLSYFLSTAHMIGYNPVGIARADDPKMPVSGYSSISLSDGNMLSFMSAADMALMLNGGNYIPLPHELLIQLLNYRKQKRVETR